MTFSAQTGLVAETNPASVLVGEAKDIAEVLVSYRSADAAEALNGWLWGTTGPTPRQMQ